MPPSYSSVVLPQQLELASSLQAPTSFLRDKGNLRAAIRSHPFQSLQVRWANEALSAVPIWNSKDTTDLGQQLSNLTVHITTLRGEKKKKDKIKGLGRGGSRGRKLKQTPLWLLEKGARALGTQTGLEGRCICWNSFHLLNSQEQVFWGLYFTYLVTLQSPFHHPAKEKTKKKPHIWKQKQSMDQKIHYIIFFSSEY